MKRILKSQYCEPVVKATAAGSDSVIALSGDWLVDDHETDPMVEF